MPNTYGNRIKVSTSTTGTGTITLGSAVEGFQTFSSGGITDGNTVAYVIEDGANFEIGTGTYTASGTTLTRTVSESTNSNSAISLSGDAVVFVAPSASDLPFTDGASFSGAVTFAEDVTFDGATAGRDIVFDRSDNALEFADNAKAVFGTGSDLDIYHDGTSSIVESNLAGAYLRLRSAGGVVINVGATENALFAQQNGETALYYDGSKKIKTTTAGIEVTGTVTDDGAVHDGDVTFTGLNYSAVWDKSDNSLRFNDGALAKFGTGGDLQITHNGGAAYLTNDTGHIYFYNYANDRDIVFKSDDGSGGLASYIVADGGIGEVQLYHYGSQKLATKSTGVDVTGNITVSGTVDGRDVATDGTKLDGIEASADVTDATNVAAAGAAMTTGATFTGNVEHNDNVRARFGNTDDLQIYHHGGSYLTSNDGGFYIDQTSNDASMFLRNDDGSGGVANYVVTDGSTGEVQLHHYGSLKFATKSTGAQVTGTLTATAFSGDGSSLTNLSATDSTKMPLSGGTFTGDVTFNEDLLVGQNDKLWLGYVGSATQGLQLFHGGSSATIENHNNAIYYKSDGHIFRRHSTDREYMTLNEDLNHTVSLKASGSTRLQTSGTGVTVTGALNINSAYTLPTSDGSANQVLSTDGSGNLSFADAGGNSSNVAGGSYIGGSYAGANIVASSGNYNTLLGQYAGNDVTTGDANVAVGYASLELVTTASSSTAIGAYAARYNTGADNVALGADALTGSSGSSSGNLNVAIGRQAGRYVTTGFKNILIGGYAGNSIQTGTSNILIGNDSGRYSTGGFNAVAIGVQAGGGENVSGSFNNSVAVGNQSGGNSTGGRNSYLGYYAGRYRTSGSDNTAIGNRSQLGVSGQTTMVSALPNTSVGSESLYGITTGLSNVAMGYRAGRSISSGGNNVLIGNDAGYSLTTHNNNIAIGTNAAKYTTNISNISIGYNSMGGYSSTGDNNYRNLIIGHEAARSHDTGENTFIGYQAGYRRVTGTQHTAIGYQSQYGSAENNTYNANTSVGHSTLYNISTGKNNVAMGYKALYDNTTGNQNLAIGNSAGENITSGFENIAIGHETFYTATGAYRNTAVGYQALYTTTTNENAAFGWQALREASSGSANTAVGAHALSTVSTGYYNTALGYRAGDNITTGYNNIVIGYQAYASAVSVNNEVTIGDSNITRFRVPGAGIDNTSAALSGTTPSIDVSARDTYTLTTSGNTTFTFTNVPSSPQVAKFTLILTAGGTYTLTWPTSVDWAGGSAPSAPASGEKNIYTFMSIDGGTNWYGFLAGAAFA